jgi:hypothetical protein
MSLCLPIPSGHLLLDRIHIKILGGSAVSDALAPHAISIEDGAARNLLHALIFPRCSWCVPVARGFRFGPTDLVVSRVPSACLISSE